MKTLTKWIASFFYVGYMPVAPGTCGSLAGILWAWVFHDQLLFWTAAFCVLGFLACRPSQTIFQSKDPSRFVMDEVCGMMLSVLWLPKSLLWYVVAFLFFRLFDVVKPWPISAIQRNSHPFMIMIDDLLAGVFANLVIRLLIVFFGIR